MEAINNISNRNKVHPYVVALWIGCAAIVMMFASLTSAYIVRKGAGNWLEFKLPSYFIYNTLVILLSSVTMQISYNSFKKGNFKVYKLALISTLILGIIFTTVQYLGWKNLDSIGVTLTGNPSGSFIYVIPGIHLAHLIGGILGLIMACFHAFSLPEKFSEIRKVRLEVTTTYWHFIGFLWVYLILFFIYS